MNKLTLIAATVILLASSNAFAIGSAAGQAGGAVGNGGYGGGDGTGMAESGLGSFNMAGTVANDNKKNGWGKQITPNVSFPSFPFGTGIFGGPIGGKPANQNGYYADYGYYTEFGYSGGGYGSGGFANDPGGTGGQD